VPSGPAETEGSETALDQYRDLYAPAHFGHSWPACPARRHLIAVERRTGEVVPARCDRVPCYACIVPVALKVVDAIALARPSHWVTLTSVGVGWQAVRRNFAGFTERLRRRGTTFEFSYHVEHPASHLSAHAHLWWWGDKPNERLLSEVAGRSHMGTYARAGELYVPAESFSRPSFEYGLKDILWNRPAEPTSMWPAAENYLRNNGNRLIHGTAGFYRDGNEGLSGLGEAMRRARQHRAGGDWTLAPA
jgi:hypothetical protein